jgi:hypothetical protein
MGLKIELRFTFKKIQAGTMVHTCNASYSGGRGRGIKVQHHLS